MIFHKKHAFFFQIKMKPLIGKSFNYKLAIHISRELSILNLIDHCLWPVSSKLITQKNDFYCRERGYIIRLAESSSLCQTD